MKAQWILFMKLGESEKNIGVDALPISSLFAYLHISSEICLISPVLASLVCRAASTSHFTLYLLTLLNWIMFLTTPVDTTKASVFKYFYTQQT